MTILLMTATVTPPANASKLSRTDPIERLGDYERALQFYIGKMTENRFNSIVFVDNSNSDISRLRFVADQSDCSSRIEFISFDGLNYPQEYGRAYGELRLIDYAMSTSNKIRLADPDELVWKVTGRYIILNIKKLVEPRNNAVMYCHCRDFPRRWADMYLIGWKKNSYMSTFGGVADRIKESIDISRSSEEEFRQVVDERSRTENVVRRFSEAPKILGVRGWDNMSYKHGGLKDYIRRSVERFIPWIWI